MNKSVIARCVLALLFGYLAFSGIRAVFAFGQSVWGDSWYTLNSDTEHAVYDQYGHELSTAQLAKQDMTWGAGGLRLNGVALATSDDGLVTVYRPAATAYQQHKPTAQLWPLLIALIALGAAWRHGLMAYGSAKLRGAVSWLGTRNLVLIGGLGVFALAKVGVIDYRALGEVVRGLHFGFNYYVHDALLGASGRLTIFPYNPLSLLWTQWLSGVDADLLAVGIHLRSYSLISLSVFGAYLWMCMELSALLLPHWRWSRRSLFLILLLNPFGLYYAVFLGQIDIIAIALVVAGGSQVLRRGGFACGTTLLILAAVFSKPQHALVLPAMVLAMLAAKDLALKGRLLLSVLAAGFSVAAVYWLYSQVPAFALSLRDNPQAARVGWATWYQVFGDSVVVNRPIAFLMMAFLLVACRVRAVTTEGEVWCVLVLALAALTAWFQASYAHTFGMAILMYPAIMLMAVECKDRWRGAVLWLASILLLCDWGTGTVDDFTRGFGLHLFSGQSLQRLTLLGINYPSLLMTLEMGAYMAFGLLLVIRLLAGAQGNTPANQPWTGAIDRQSTR